MTQSKYLQVFVEESREHIQNMNHHLMQMETSSEATSAVEEIFRSAHTIKGMAASMEYEKLTTFTHALENVFDLLRNEEVTVTSSFLDQVFDAVDAIEEMINNIAAGGDGNHDITTQLEQLETLRQHEGGGQAEATVGKTHRLSFDEFEQTVLNQAVEQGFTPYEMTITLETSTLLKAARVHMVFQALENHGEVIKTQPSVEDLEDEQFENTFRIALLSKSRVSELKRTILQISEIESMQIDVLDETPARNSQIKEKSGKTAHVTGKETKRTIKVDIERLDALMNLFEEWVIDRGRLEKTALELQHPVLTETVERMNRISSDLQTVILNLRMMSVDHVFNRFPRMVRKVSRDLGKKVMLDIVGADTELDRTIIDEIGDPLIHLLRNSIDHGIESPEERKAAGKSETGTIRLSAYHNGNHVYIRVSDDGAGIDKEKVVAKAIRNGILTEEDTLGMSDEKTYSLLFSNGFSTAENITDVSGRGVGLDVVRSTFESLGGIVSVNAERGKGSVFSIRLPLTLSIVDVLLIELENEKYGIPISSIVETTIISKADIFQTHNQPVLDFRGHVIPLLFLYDVFNVSTRGHSSGGHDYSVVIVHKGERYVALIVDGFIGQKEVVLKSLGNYLQDVFAISGATILGDGEVALIMDASALIE